MRGQNSIVERYQKLGLREFLNRSYQYPTACKELSFILRNAYHKTPKNLQTLIFQDLITAFTLLSQMQTQSCVSAANILLQSAEASLPKQKRTLALTEFKHAMVAQKRRCKAQQEGGGLAQLPQDVLVYIFSLLDLQSLISASAVCRYLLTPYIRFCELHMNYVRSFSIKSLLSNLWRLIRQPLVSSWPSSIFQHKIFTCRLWNAASSDNHLWESLYDDFFRDFSIHSKVSRLQIGKMVDKKDRTSPNKDLATGLRTDWRQAFKRAYKGNSAKKLKSYRGYCRNCSSIVWLSHHEPTFRSSRDNCTAHQIKTISSEQVVDYLLNDSFSSYSSSDSDTDTEEGCVLKLWSYPQIIQYSS